MPKYTTPRKYNLYYPIGTYIAIAIWWILIIVAWLLISNKTYQNFPSLSPFRAKLQYYELTPNIYLLAPLGEILQLSNQGELSVALTVFVWNVVFYISGSISIAIAQPQKCSFRRLSMSLLGLVVLFDFIPVEGPCYIECTYIFLPIVCALIGYCVWYMVIKRYQLK